jgi:hypothetical protein
MIFSDSTLRLMSQQNPRTLEALKRVSGVGDYKLQRYGQAFLNALSVEKIEAGQEEQENVEIENGYQQERIKRKIRKNKNSQEIPENSLMSLNLNSKSLHFTAQQTEPISNCPPLAPNPAFNPQTSQASPLRISSLPDLSESLAETLTLYQKGFDLAAIAQTRSLKPTTIAEHFVKLIETNHITDLDSLISPTHQRAILQAIDVLGDERLMPIYEQLQGKYAYEEIKLVRAYWRQNAMEF